MPAALRSIMRIFIFMGGLALFTNCVFGQQNPLRREYIEKYSEMAVVEMRRSGIPASITMAQAILESSLGRSDLATRANNHFGIKCHVGWEGKRFYYDDDEKDECFRVYRNAEESFRDHSIFLLTRDRYKGLFELDPLDYRGWARGLKEAGYATNPRYADQLIKIIEEEQLYQLDNWIPQVAAKNSTADEPADYEDGLRHKPTSYPMQMHKRNRIDFIVVQQGETVESLTDRHNMLKWEIRKYNELEKKEQPVPGSIIYLQPKRKRAARGFKYHTVREGETIYSISQHFGIKTKWILKRNGLEEETILREGERIWLRGKNPAIK